MHTSDSRSAPDPLGDQSNTSGTINTDVLVVGSGPAGASTAVMLARHGLNVTMITRGNWVADSPRAHITNQRTMEVLRAIGLEEACRAAASPAETMANQVLCTTIAGEEIARTWSWGANPARKGEYLTSSPGPGCDLPQDRLEPILVGEAARLGVKIRFSTKFESLQQDTDGVTVMTTDLNSGESLMIRAMYVVGADGGQSKVADAIGLPLTGEAGIANAMNVRFSADLSRYVKHRPGSLFAVIQPDRVDGMGHAMVRMSTPWHDWVVSFVHLGARNGKLTAAEAEYEVRQLLGDDSIEVKVTGLFPWRINHVVADYYSVDRVLCIGDAVHRHPPMNGLGANTCIQDGFNLAWKLAFVLKGFAGAGLLDSYSVERQPIGKQVVDRAITSWRGEGELLGALGLDPQAPVEVRREQFAEIYAATDAGEARRAAIKQAYENKSYVYHANGVEMNQIYSADSAAVVANGVDPYVFTQNPELIIQQTSHPGARLPHAWVGDQNRTVSTLDLTSPEQFTLFVRERGTTWVRAAEKIVDELQIPLRTVTIGFGGDVSDLYGDFAARSEISEGGCLLVRPDQHIAWRKDDASDQAYAELLAVMQQVLSR